MPRKSDPIYGLSESDRTSVPSNPDPDTQHFRPNRTYTATCAKDRFADGVVMHAQRSIGMID